MKKPEQIGMTVLTLVEHLTPHSAELIRSTLEQVRVTTLAEILDDRNPDWEAVKIVHTAFADLSRLFEEAEKVRAYVIQNIENTELYWSVVKGGWVDFNHATYFSDGDRVNLPPPEGGRWLFIV